VRNNNSVNSFVYDTKLQYLVSEIYVIALGKNAPIKVFIQFTIYTLSPHKSPMCRDLNSNLL
jgi:hypothetical protein